VKFVEFGLEDRLLEALSYMGFEEATPIQEKAIPVILEGRDLIACAQTGTGKTAAFILPTLNELIKDHDPYCTTLIVVPTRELALQIDKQIQGFAYFTEAHSFPVYGGGDGQDWVKQKKALTGGADIIVATPGKLISHLNTGHVNFDHVQHLILDEADRMLDMGFVDDIMKIASFLPKKRQNLMFSATMPPKIRQLAKRLLENPGEISLEMSKPAEGVLQGAFLVYDPQKIPLVKQLIADKPNYKSILIFSSTKQNVHKLHRALRNKNYLVEAISSDLDQSEREAVLSRFRSKKTRVLVATDVISRGIDIKDINLVINIDVPKVAEDYVHRVGRTARADTTGVALTFINSDDMHKFHHIEELIGSKIMKMALPKELGEGPEWNIRARRNSGSHSGGGKRKFQKRKGKPRR
jgi:superfamily II DNA/RNA helicase